MLSKNTTVRENLHEINKEICNLYGEYKTLTTESGPNHFTREMHREKTFSPEKDKIRGSMLGQSSHAKILNFNNKVV